MTEANGAAKVNTVSKPMDLINVISPRASIHSLELELELAQDVIYRLKVGWE